MTVSDEQLAAALPWYLNRNAPEMTAPFTCRQMGDLFGELLDLRAEVQHLHDDNTRLDESVDRALAECEAHIDMAVDEQHRANAAERELAEARARLAAIETQCQKWRDAISPDLQKVSVSAVAVAQAADVIAALAGSPTKEPA